MNVVRGKILSKKQHGWNVGLSNFCFGGRVAGWTLEVSYGGETYTVESMFCPKKPYIGFDLDSQPEDGIYRDMGEFDTDGTEDQQEV